ncbi:signal peptidase II [Effusibacillus dendaii]|uniref:Lipoprotein signal peptidase n=1 Tax=Effusibacillus dendaii TaxID=2743772 RepID=A0A7I8DB32_9BACL|nr:signal peptidase II [Effusibacillus dendaii]BCJ86046.1 lipoprotein signal peptidase [Effusibacillus dendaii]
MLYVWAILVVILDQITKYLVKTRMVFGESIPVLGDFLLITSHRNQGAAWGVFAGQRWLFVLIAIAVIIGVVYYSRRVKSPLIRAALPLLLGGAVGNLIDRILYGEVVDFLDVRVINYPIFNLADSAIVIAICLILLDTWREYRQERVKGE